MNDKQHYSVESLLKAIEQHRHANNRDAACVDGYPSEVRALFKAKALTCDSILARAAELTRAALAKDDGYVMVPMEMTHQMYAAWCAPDDLNGSIEPSERVRQRYAAMLAAAK